ncbi:MAG: L,D-transpeptidase [Rhizobiaceae bacterium]
MHLRKIVLAGLGVLLLSSGPVLSAQLDRMDTGALAKQNDIHKTKSKKKAVSKKRHGAEPQPAALVNNGELRSGEDAHVSFLSVIFGGGDKPEMLPETRALDAELARKQDARPFTIKPAFEPQSVPFSGYPKGTLVIDTSKKFLYLVESSTTARRYPIAVGREGLQFKGDAVVGDKQEWPRWIPTKDMQKRNPKEYGKYKDGMPGGPSNPLGSRAIYLYQNGKDTHVRIHGTTEPWTVGHSASNGCFRMYNSEVMDLYQRVPKGAHVVVL